MSAVKLVSFLWMTSLLLSVGLAGAEPPLKPIRVCEVLQDLKAYDGKVVAIVGRFSFRETGRFLSEENCEKQVKTSDFVWPSVLRLSFSSKSAPKAPLPLEFDGTIVKEELKLIRLRTSLGKFRFGTPDYDRWAVIYGRVETVKEYRDGPTPVRIRANGLEPAPAQLVCGGDGDILVITEP